MGRLRHWWRVVRAGFWTVPTITSWVIVVVGGSVVVGFGWGRKHLLLGIILLLVGLVVTILEGSYRESTRIRHDNALKLKALETRHKADLEAAHGDAANRRMLAQPPRLQLLIEPTLSAIESWCDVVAYLDAWEERERTRRLAARYKPESRSDEESPVMTGSSFWSAGIPDSRTSDEYAAQIEAYLKKARAALTKRAIWRLERYPPAMLSLQIVNPSEGNFAKVRLTVVIDIKKVRGLDAELLKIADEKDEPRLPKPPLPLGTTMAGRSSDSERFGFGYMPASFNFTGLGRYPLGRPWRAVNTDEEVRIDFEPCDVRPDETVRIPCVPLVVLARPGAEICVNWEATATNANGKITGSLVVAVSKSTFGESLLSELALGR